MGVFFRCRDLRPSRYKAGKEIKVYTELKPALGEFSQEPAIITSTHARIEFVESVSIFRHAFGWRSIRCWRFRATFVGKYDQQIRHSQN